MLNFKVQIKSKRVANPPITRHCEEAPRRSNPGAVTTGLPRSDQSIEARNDKKWFGIFNLNFKIIILSLFLCLGLFVFAEIPTAHAAFEPIVKCGLDPATPAAGCQVRDIFATAKRVIDYLFAAAAVIAVGGVVYGGVLMTTSAGNQGRVAAGQKAIKNSLIGLGLVLVSVLIVQTVFTLLKYQGPDPLDPNNARQQGSIYLNKL